MTPPVNSRLLRAFLREYESYALSVLTPTAKEIRALFDTWTDQSFWAASRGPNRTPIPSPIQSKRVRIKRPESVVDKILRKPDSFPEHLSIDSVRMMRDAVAGRVVVYFLANLPLIDKTIRNSDIVEVSKDDPPVAYQGQDTLERLGLRNIDRDEKDSGYTSIHYIVRLRTSEVPKGDRPWFEVQVRTLAEHVWGEIEHILGYKPGKKTSFAVRKQFKIIGSQLTAIDEHFNFLYEELSRFQREGIFAEDDFLNAENLPPVLDKVGVGSSQREIDGLLKLLASRGFQTVGSFLEVASKENIDLIRKTYQHQEGRQPINFEVVACLAAIKGAKDRRSMIEAIRTQTQFLEAWGVIKGRAVNNRRGIAHRSTTARRKRRAR